MNGRRTAKKLTRRQLKQTVIASPVSFAAVHGGTFRFRCALAPETGWLTAATTEQGFGLLERLAMLLHRLFVRRQSLHPRIKTLAVKDDLS